MESPPGTDPGGRGTATSVYVLLRPKTLRWLVRAAAEDAVVRVLWRHDGHDRRGRDNETRQDLQRPAASRSSSPLCDATVPPSARVTSRRREVRS